MTAVKDLSGTKIKKYFGTELAAFDRSRFYLSAEIICLSAIFVFTLQY
jgi:hypothetical protein